MPTAFTHNRERLIAHDVAGEFFRRGASTRRRRASLMSGEHFTVDGTLIEACGEPEELQAEGRRRHAAAGRSGESDRGLPRREARQRDARVDDGSGREARAQGQGQGGEALVSRARADGESQRPARRSRASSRDGTAERDAALVMLARPARAGQRVDTLGADKAYDTRDFVAACRSCRVTPHVAQNHARRPQRDRRAHDAASGLRGQPAEAEADRGGLRLEQDGGPAPEAAPPRARDGGLDLTFTQAAYNLVRLRTLITAGVCRVNYHEALRSTQSRVEASENAAMEPAGTSLVTFAIPGLKRWAEHCPVF